MSSEGLPGYRPKGESDLEKRQAVLREGTVNPKDLAEASRRKLAAGGMRTLKEYIEDVRQGRVSPDDKQPS